LFINRITQTTQPTFAKIGGKVAHWQRKNPFDFGGNLAGAVLEKKTFGGPAPPPKFCLPTPFPYPFPFPSP